MGVPEASSLPSGAVLDLLADMKHPKSSLIITTNFLFTSSITRIITRDRSVEILLYSESPDISNHSVGSRVTILNYFRFPWSTCRSCQDMEIKEMEDKQAG